MSIQHSIKLTAYYNGKTATPQNCNDEYAVLDFFDANNKVHVSYHDDGIQLTRMYDDDSTSSFILPKHKTLNIYTGICNGIKVHVSLKKMVGELRYWA